MNKIETVELVVFEFPVHNVQLQFLDCIFIQKLVFAKLVVQLTKYKVSRVNQFIQNLQTAKTYNNKKNCYTSVLTVK